MDVAVRIQLTVDLKDLDSTSLQSNLMTQVMCVMGKTTVDLTILTPPPLLLLDLKPQWLMSYESLFSLLDHTIYEKIGTSDTSKDLRQMEEIDTALHTKSHLRTIHQPSFHHNLYNCSFFDLPFHLTVV